MLDALATEYNRLRYAGPNHVESYFLRAVDPGQPRALWAKATLFAPSDGEPVAETWFIYFDGERKRTFARKDTVPLREATFAAGEAGRIDAVIAKTAFTLGAVGRIRGEMDGKRGEATWDVTWATTGGRFAAPLSIYPAWLPLSWPLPKFKAVTPFPSLRFSGYVRVFGEEIRLEGWTGAQGHNFGSRHHDEYAWTQCVVPETEDSPCTMVEGGTGRLGIGGVLSPRLSMLTVRRGDEEWRFDALWDVWRQRSTVRPWQWTVRLQSRDAAVILTTDAGRMPMVCLGYPNPDHSKRYCFNTKLAQMWLSVQPRHGKGFQVESRHGAALEMLQASAHPQFPDVV